MSYKQMTLAMQSDSGFEKHRKPTRRDEFLAQMDNEPPREPRRPFGLSHAACFCSATFA